MRAGKELRSLVIGFLGAMLGLYGAISIDQHMLYSLRLDMDIIRVMRLFTMPILYWLIALVPIVLMRLDGDTLEDLGFRKSELGAQVLEGIVIGLAMSLVFTLLPHLFGFGAYVDNGKRYQYLWQFLYEFAYCIAAVALVEELVFRGFLYCKIKRICQHEWVAVLGSSILFGVFHLFGGDPVQMVMTAGLGALWCVCRLKLKNCSTLSLIIAHGIYDALITIWASAFL